MYRNKLLLNLAISLALWIYKAVALTDNYPQCHCVALKNCDTLTRFIDQSDNISLMVSTITEAVCHFDGSTIYVCCPPKSFRKRHVKVKTQLDYLDELSGLNCPPSFGKEYSYDEYLKEHSTDDDSDDNYHSGEDEKSEESSEIEDDNTGVMCDHLGNCGRFKFPSDDDNSYHKPSPNYHQFHHDHREHNPGYHQVFNAPLFPFHHHHHHHDHYNSDNNHYIPTFPQYTSEEGEQNKNDNKCGTITRDTANTISTEVYPWIVRLAYLNTTSRTIRHRCLGTIITDEHVLTAAHCVDKLVKDLRLIYVRVGDDTNFDDFKILETLVHPNYNEPLFNNDVALIRLAKTRRSRVIFTSICLPQNDSQVAMGNTGIVAGWSENGMSSVTRSTIRYINLPVINNTECAIRYAKYSENFENSIVITPREFCAQAEAMNDVCEGDSGGPFMERSTSGRYSLLGIVAFGPKTNCGNSNLPGVYMRVSSFVEWIRNNTV